MYSQQLIIAGPHLNFDTGINFQLKYLIHFIQKTLKYNVIYCCIGAAKVQDKSKFDFPIYDISSSTDLINIIDKYNIKILISSHDLVKTDFILLSKIQRSFYWIHYFMSEADNHGVELVTNTDEGISRGSLENIINHIDKLIPATQTSRISYIDLLHQIKQLDDFNLDTIEIIDSFIDFSFSFSKDSREITRKSLGLSDDDFLFLVVARNQPRKNLPIYFEALSKINNQFKSNQNLDGIKVKLFVLSWPISPMGYDLEYLKKYYHLENLVFLRDISNYTEEFSKSLLNDIYCAADTLLSCPYAEGFGYPIVESALCDTPSIISNCNEMQEIFNINPHEKIKLLKKGNDFFFPNVNQRWSYTNVDELVEAMTKNVFDFQFKKSSERDNSLSNLIKSLYENNKPAENHWNYRINMTQRIIEKGIK